MPIPAIPNYSRIWVRGRFVDLARAANEETTYGLTGPVTFTPSPKVLLSAGTRQIISTGGFSATPAATDGYFQVNLPATDDPDINPTGFTYAVTEPTGRKYNIIIPIATPVLNSPGDPLHGERVIELISVVPAPAPNAGSVQLIMGADGRGIASMDVDGSGDVIVTYEDDATDNLGPLPTAAPEFIRDTMGAALVAGTNVTITVDDGADTITVAATGGSGGGAPVVNVKDHGAVGDGTTDDAAAINAAATAAVAAGDGCRLYFPPTNNSYRVLSQIVVPDGVNLDMSEAGITYAGPLTQTAMVVGSGARESYRRHIVSIVAVPRSNWTNPACVGVEIRSQYYGRIDLNRVEGFTVGAVLAADATGFVYNRIDLGRLYDNQVGLRLTSRNDGWCNENKFYGGSFGTASGTETGKSRYGVWITSESGTPYYQNANVFYGPSFEIQGNAGVGGVEGVAAVVEYGHYNRFRDCRHESPSAVSLRTLNNSQFNQLDTTFNATAAGTIPIADDQGAFPTSVVRPGSFNIHNESVRVAHRHPGLAQVACFYDGATQVTVPGLAVQASGTTFAPTRAGSGLTITADYVEISGTRMLGFFLSTRALKRFTVHTDTHNSQGGRVTVVCFDSTGAVLTGGSHVKGWSGRTFTSATSFGGAYRTGTDDTGQHPGVFFSVTAGVDYVFVGVSGGSNPARVRALAVGSPDPGAARVWLPFPDDGVTPYVTAPPSAGTWVRGFSVRNDLPSAGGPPGWVCVTGGSPGTWRAMANLAA